MLSVGSDPDFQPHHSGRVRDHQAVEAGLGSLRRCMEMQIRKGRLHLRIEGNQTAKQGASADVRKRGTHTSNSIATQRKLKERDAKRSVSLLRAGVDPRKHGEVGCLLLEFGTISLFD